MKKRKAMIDAKRCVACGTCVKVCPMDAIHIIHGTHAEVSFEACVGCGKCAKECPADVIHVQEVTL